MHHTEDELEQYFSRVRASFSKRTFVTFCDLLYLLIINLPIFIFTAYHQSGQNIVSTFHKFVESTESKIQAHRLLIFSIWMLIVCYVYFVIIPTKTNFQTLFSNFWGTKAVLIRRNPEAPSKLTQKALFKANLIPVFLLIFLNIIFWAGATIVNDSEWHTMLKKNGGEGEKISWMRIFAVGAFALQMHYLFTVAASKKALNWFNKHVGIIYVDVEKTKFLMKVEGKENRASIDMPGLANLQYRVYNDISDEEDEKGDFKQDIYV